MSYDGTFWAGLSLPLPGPKELLALVAIVRATAEREILRTSRATARERDDVMKLQMPRLGAPSS
jgi:hypothetical protein